MENININIEELKKILEKTFSNYNATFSTNGDEYHDDYKIDRKYIVDKIIKQIK